MSDAAPRVGFGGVALATQPTWARARRLVHAALDAGIDYFDTAPTYSRGLAERLLGRILRDARADVQVATKFGLGHPSPPPLPATLLLPLLHRRRPAVPAAAAAAAPTLPAPRPITAAAIRADLESSLRALRRDRIDVYLLHEAVPAWLTPGAWEFLAGERRSGRLGRLGVATSGRHLATQPDAALADWDVVQYELGPGWPETRGLPARFPGRQHTVHSSLRRLPDGLAPSPELLRDTAAKLPAGGRLLFSTSDPQRLRDNLRALRR